jgi:Ca-activated chloride channel family protein
MDREPTTMTRSLLASALTLALVEGSAAASEPGPGSPYFLIQSDDPQETPLRLRATRADAEIAGVIAHVHTTQVYEWEGSRPIDALYVFPGWKRAALVSMKVTVGDRVIEAGLAAQERAASDREGPHGQTAEPREPQHADAFRMRVANIMPGDPVTVELDYTELLVPADSTYEIVYPAVVEPRTTAESNAARRRIGSALAAARDLSGSFELHVRIAAGVPIADVTSPSHDIHPRFPKPSIAEVTVAGASEADRDVVIRYEMLGSTIQTGLLRFEDEQEKFFLLMVQPPLHLRRDDIVPREYLFIVDVSGSMQGSPLATTQALMRGLLEGLRSEDRFNILYFASSGRRLAQRSMPVTTRNVGRALRAVVHENNSGSDTSLQAALDRAMETPAENGTARILVVFSDGHVDVASQTFDTIRGALGEASLLAVGVGERVNGTLIEDLARAGLSEPFFIDSVEDSEAARFHRTAASVALTDVEADLEALGAYDIEPPRIPDLLTTRPIVVTGKYRGADRGTATLEGVAGSGGVRHEIEIDADQVDTRHRALRGLWSHMNRASLGEQSGTQLGVRPDQPATGAVGRDVEESEPTARAGVLDMHERFDVGALVSDRPSSGISSATVGRFRVQLETGADLAFDRPGGHGRQRFRFPTTLRVGLMDPVELRVASRLLSLAPAGKGRWEDVAVGLKLSLGSSDQFRLGALVSLSFATGDPSVTRGEKVPHARLAADFALPAGMSLGANLGLELVDSDSDRVSTTLTLSRSVALESSSIGLFAGYSGVTLLDGGAGEYSLEAGLTWLLAQPLQLDLFYRLALNREPENAVLGFGFTVQL